METQASSFLDVGSMLHFTCWRMGRVSLELEFEKIIKKKNFEKVLWKYVLHAWINFAGTKEKQKEMRKFADKRKSLLSSSQFNSYNLNRL